MSAVTINAPSGGDTKVATYNSSMRAVIAVPQPVERAGWNEAPAEPLPPIMVAAPAGSHALYSAPRQRGDWYAEFTAGRRMSCAVAQAQADAVRLAAEKMEQAA